MSAVLYTPAEYAAILRGDVQNLAYLETPLGPHVADCLTYLRVEKGRRPKTLGSYERHLARMCLFLADKPTLEEITVTDLRAVLSTYGDKLQHRQVGWSAMRTFWKYLYREELVERNPMERIDSPPARVRKPADLFTPAEEALIVNQQWIRDRVGVLLLLRAGLRNSECRNVQRRHIDLAELRLMVPDGKGGKPRVIPIAGELVRALNEYLMMPIPGLPGREPEPTDYVLYVTGGNRYETVTWARPWRPMSETAFNSWWHRMLKAAGVKYRHPHIARHTCLTRLDQLGVRASVIAAVAGHASVQTTLNYYVRVDERDAAEAMQLRERSLDGARF